MEKMQRKRKKLVDYERRLRDKTTTVPFFLAENFFKIKTKSQTQFSDQNAELVLGKERAEGNSLARNGDGF